MDSIRRIVRSTLGYDSRAYRTAARILTSTEIVRREGIGMLATIRDIDAMPTGEPQPVKFENLTHPIEVRPSTTDLNTVIDTVVREEYGRHLPERELLTLIDAGAFIGDTSAWYLSRYPRLRTWALEPNPANYPLAVRNLSHYGERATVLPLALASREGKVRFSGEATGGAISDDGIEVETTTVTRLLEQIPGDSVDVLKIDIEGAELDVFSAGAEVWLPKVGLIIVELHGPEIERAVLAVLHRHGFETRQYRSVWYCRKGS